MNFLTELVQFMVLIPSAILCLLPMKNQLVISYKKLFLLGIALLFVVTTACASLSMITNVSINVILLPAALLLFFCYQRVLKSHFLCERFCFFACNGLDVLSLRYFRGHRLSASPL